MQEEVRAPAAVSLQRNLSPSSNAIATGLALVLGLKAHAGLVVLIPLLFGMAGLAAATLSPGPYQSMTVLRLSDEGATNADALMRTPVVLDEVLQKFPDVPGATLEQKRRTLNERFEWTWPNTTARQKAQLFFFLVRDGDPARAKALSSELLDAWLEASKPRPDNRAKIQLEIDRLQAQFNSTSILVQQYEREAKTLISPNSLEGELAGPLVQLIGKREDLNRQIALKQDDLRGVSRDTIIGPPTFPTERADVWRPLKWSGLGWLSGLVLITSFVAAKEIMRSYLAANSEFMLSWRTARWGVFGGRKRAGHTENTQ